MTQASRANRRRRPQSPINIGDIAPILREMQAVVAREEVIIHSVKQAMVKMLQERYGVDLSKEHWTLDLELSMLTKDDDGPTNTRR